RVLAFARSRVRAFSRSAPRIRTWHVDRLSLESAALTRLLAKEKASTYTDMRRQERANARTRERANGLTRERENARTRERANDDLLDGDFRPTGAQAGVFVLRGFDAGDRGVDHGAYRQQLLTLG